MGYAEHADRSSFEAYVFRLLRDKREQVVETLSVEHCYQSRMGQTNTHRLVPFRNLLAASVGIRQIPDPNGMPIEDAEAADARLRFWYLYSVDALISELGSALNEMPRRIPYDVLLAWLKENTPAFADTYSFLSASFDVNGHVCRATIEYALWRMGVLRSPTEYTSGPWALKLQIGSQEWQGLDAYMALAQRWGFMLDPAKCLQVVRDVYTAVPRVNDPSQSEETLESLRASLASAEKEICDGPVRASPAEDWLVAGAFVNNDLTAPVWEQLLRDTPRVRALLQAARSHLTQGWKP